MDDLRQKRKPVRAAFTKVVNQIETLLQQTVLNGEQVELMGAQLEDKGAKLIALDTEILGLMQREGCTQEDYDREFEAADGYNDRFIQCRIRTKRALERLEGNRDNRELRNNAGPNAGVTRKYRLPEIELKKFAGDLRDWLGFWGLFRKIDEDNDIALEDKYQYLIQATLPSSRAREMVESFPPTADNYSKAIAHLKSRFGREDVLVEVYVRDLLRLVLNRAVSPRQRMPLASLYDKLETQLRALETLGVTSDKCAAMLYPLVESCLPEEILRVWERNRGGTSQETGSATAQASTNRLTSLMKFLQSEVDGEERIHLARSGFGLEGENRKKPTPKEVRREWEEEIPTAAGLYSGSSTDSQTKRIICVFCDKGHLSQDCRLAKRWTTERKRQRLMQQKCCFLCLKKGHRSRNCTSKPACESCQNKHYTVMCPTSKGECGVVGNSSGGSHTEDHSLANPTGTKEVMMQTLRVYLRNGEKKLLVRALIDTGSQRSYIGERAAQLMGYEELGGETVIHSLFGGQETAKQRHKLYRVHLSDVKETYRCNFEVLDQLVICRNVPCLRVGSWTAELRCEGISLSDVGSTDSAATEQVAPEIQLLIGADVSGRLLTGRIFNTGSGPVAVETSLGWTLIGKTPETVHYEEDNTLTAISLLTIGTCVSDLWKLESIGITEPSERQTDRELQEAAMTHFRNTVEREPDGRYVVSLPWLTGRPQLASGRELAERRLKGTVARLKAAEILGPYQQILWDWERAGIVERVLDEQVSDRVHYLPHRAVVKTGSSTTKIRPVFDASARERKTPSLNDCLETGPNLITLIPSILSRFRLRAIGAVADIRQAFLQIGIQERDRDFLRFLWWENGDAEHTQVFRHRRVVFGLSASPFLLGATLMVHLESPPVHLEEAAEIPRESFYVDNCVVSVDNAASKDKFITDARELLSSVAFDLRGWRGNAEGDSLDKSTFGNANLGREDHSSNCAKDMDPQNCETDLVPVLGLLWNVRDDTLQCDIRASQGVLGGVVTKRQLLAAASRLFDPLGFICPYTLMPRLLLQASWSLGIGWDTTLPEGMARDFLSWQEQLPQFSEIRIPRWIRSDESSRRTRSLHVFCDASGRTLPAFFCVLKIIVVCSATWYEPRHE